MPDPIVQQPVPAQVTPSPKPDPNDQGTIPDVASMDGKKPDEMSSKFAALAKKERITRLAQYNLKQKESAIAKREQEIAQRQQEIEDRFKLWDEEFKKSPIEAIKKRGYSYEDMTKAALNDGKFDPATEVKEVRSELQRLRDEQAQEKQKNKEDQEAKNQADLKDTIDRFRTNIGEHIESNKEKYEFTALFDASEHVFETVDRHFEATTAAGKPKIMSIDEACELVEKYLEGEVERMATSSKKFQSKYSSTKKEPEQKAPPKNSVTLTNEHSSAAPSLLPKATEDDRIKRALAALG